MTSPEISVVVPVFNERDNITPLVDEIVAALSWIKSQWPLEVRRRHDVINSQYRKSLNR